MSLPNRLTLLSPLPLTAVLMHLGLREVCALFTVCRAFFLWSEDTEAREIRDPPARSQRNGANSAANNRTNIMRRKGAHSGGGSNLVRQASENLTSAIHAVQHVCGNRQWRSVFRLLWTDYGACRVWRDRWCVNVAFPVPWLLSPSSISRCPSSVTKLKSGLAECSRLHSRQFRLLDCTHVTAAHFGIELWGDASLRICFVPTSPLSPETAKRVRAQRNRYDPASKKGKAKRRHQKTSFCPSSTACGQRPPLTFTHWVALCLLAQVAADEIDCMNVVIRNTHSSASAHAIPTFSISVWEDALDHQAVGACEWHSRQKVCRKLDPESWPKWLPYEHTPPRRVLMLADDGNFVHICAEADKGFYEYVMCTS